MNWKEMSLLQKIIFVSGYVCLGVALLLRILMDVGVLPYIGELVAFLLGATLAAVSVSYWKKQRAVAIVCIIFGILGMVFSIC